MKSLIIKQIFSTYGQQKLKMCKDELTHLQVISESVADKHAAAKDLTHFFLHLFERRCYEIRKNSARIKGAYIYHLQKKKTRERKRERERERKKQNKTKETNVHMSSLVVFLLRDKASMHNILKCTLNTPARRSARLTPLT